MKSKTVYYCTNCGNETMKWQGRCPACGAWNSIVEHTEKPSPIARSTAAPGAGLRKPKTLHEVAGTDSAISA